MSASRKITDLLFLLFLSLIAGSTFAGIKVAAQSFNAYEITFLRSLVAFLACLPFLFLRGGGWHRGVARCWPHILLIALVGILLPFTLLNWAGGRIDSSTAGILWSTLPIFGIVLAHFLTTHDRLGPGKVAAVALGILAVWLISRHSLQAAGIAGVLPHLAVVAAALCYAVSGIVQRRLPPEVPAVFLTAATMGISAMASYIAWPMAPATLMHTGDGLAAILYLGVVTSALLAYLRLLLIRRAGYALVSYTGFLVPICSVFIGVLLLDETLPPNAYLALGIAIAALAISQWGHSRRPRPETAQAKTG